MGFYAKKVFQTAPVTSVTEPTLESNSYVNVPTVKAVVDGLGKKQLLINPDFQVNQRGETTYIGKKYTVDKWYIGGLTLTIDEGYITVTNNDITSHSLQQSIKCKGVNTFCTEVFESTEGCYLWAYTNSELTDYVKLKDLVDGRNTCVYDGNIYSVGVSIPANGSIKIYYIDLFEGNIAYPHVKEDYSNALRRCQDYLIIRDFNLSITYRYSEKRMMLKGFYEKMKGIPTLKIGSVAAYSSTGSVLVTNNITYQVYSMIFIIDATFSENLQNGNGAWAFVELTCE